jgi:hypothetical protein
MLIFLQYFKYITKYFPDSMSISIPIVLLFFSLSNVQETLLRSGLKKLPETYRNEMK